jgi:acyl transferase domain-containing protein
MKNVVSTDALSITVPDHAIAIVGIACRLPQAPNHAAFWRLLCDGVNTITHAPPHRWDPEWFADQDLTDQQKESLDYGAFLDDVDGFDAEFFNISPREAIAMDPQQRLMLELAWVALEDARIVPGNLSGSRASVFVGAMRDDYTTVSYRSMITSHTITGTHRGIIANRVSYALGLRGPSMVIDTGQSSSLVAVRMALESLRRGESSLAIAGGVHLNLNPYASISAARSGALSPDGRCFTFDARANGYVRGEGGGVVVLKKVTDALTDGNHIYCVIRGSAVNNDGATQSLTVPSLSAQQTVLRQAYEQAGIDPAHVQYVELHGTGTRRGDPVEARALATTFGTTHGPHNPLLVGSAKTNVGHLEGAAGITGLLKTVLAISHRQIPPSLNYKTPHPEIPLHQLGLHLQTTLRGWPHPNKPLIAGVSAFGIGGTNAHLILQQAPPSPATIEDPAPLPVSP